jgi:hypothetical protein
MIADSSWIDFATVDLFSILRTQVITCSSIPKAFRAQWRLALAATQSAAVDSSHSLVSLGGWKAFILLPIMLLRTPSGQERDLSTTAKWSKRFAKFWGGHFRTLLEESRQSTRPVLQQSRTHPRQDTNHEPHSFEDLHVEPSRLFKAEELAKQGLISKAAAVLNQSPIAPANSQTLQRLRQLHPRRQFPATSAIPQHTPAPQMDVSGFAQRLIVAIEDAPRRSAPGPSGWRYEHLKAVISDQQELSPVLSILTKILLAQIPPEIRDVLRTTWLIGVAKGNSSSIRPISLSDVLRRVVAKAIALKYKHSWKQTVGVHQFGVATSAGVEAVQTGVQLFLQSNPNSAVFIADGANAFNSCNRQHFLNQLYLKHPELSAFVEQWYVGEAPLWFAMDDGSIATVISSEGAQQGDPHGSFLFCLGAAPIMEEISQALPQSFIGAIIDDITIAAPIDIMPLVISTTARSLEQYGIHLALPKCLIFAPPHILPLLPSDTNPLIPRSDSGFKLLGSPLIEARDV